MKKLVMLSLSVGLLLTGCSEVFKQNESPKSFGIELAAERENQEEILNSEDNNEEYEYLVKFNTSVQSKIIENAGGEIVRGSNRIGEVEIKATNYEIQKIKESHFINFVEKIESKEVKIKPKEV